MSGWLLRVSYPTLSWNNSQAFSSSRHSTLIFFRAPISPHTSKDRVVKISFEPFSWLGIGIPTWFKATLSHKSSNNTTNFLLCKTP
ncbi:Actin-2 [Gossypium arboreum]|uniref:Actin-2 n=1 Tax=Gossypium arboreum TaxID=29729 RepID=A0A0B0MYU9_GOSAR|nr:Actin-2 [Gossypium arboreum]